MDQSAAEMIVQWYEELESRLKEVLRGIPYDKKSKSIFLPPLSNLIVDACSLLDTIFREEYQSATGMRRQLTIVDFAKEYETRLGLSEKRTALLLFPLGYVHPFGGWFDLATGSYRGLPWWRAYNELKHNRITHFSHSTLEMAVTTLGALHQVISQMPVFVDTLVRHEMLHTGSWGFDYAIASIKGEQANDSVTVLVETALFATPNGKLDFPPDPEKINPHFHGRGDRLWRYLGRQY